jgi:hypothetical protein
MQLVYCIGQDAIPSLIGRNEIDLKQVCRELEGWLVPCASPPFG